MEVTIPVEVCLSKDNREIRLSHYDLTITEQEYQKLPEYIRGKLEKCKNSRLLIQDTGPMHARYILVTQHVKNHHCSLPILPPPEWMRPYWQFENMKFNPAKYKIIMVSKGIIKLMGDIPLSRIDSNVLKQFPWITAAKGDPKHTCYVYHNEILVGTITNCSSDGPYVEKEVSTKDIIAAIEEAAKN